ncbi:hypothetical protein D3C75_1088240 [compost metagenome]
MVRADMLPGTMAHNGSIRSNEQTLRVPVRQPDRRSRRRGAHDRVDAVGMQQPDMLGKWPDINSVFHRLKLRPDELAHADEIDARFLHELKITLPGIFPPQLGIPCGPVIQFLFHSVYLQGVLMRKLIFWHLSCYPFGRQ